MKRIAIVGLASLVLAAAGCGWPQTDEERADWFFDYGEEWIIEALEEADASDAQGEAAQRVIDARRPEVTQAVQSVLDDHRELIRVLAGASPAEAMLEQEARLSDAHREALRRIGAMHEAVGEAVGEPTWERARAHMREEIAERLDEED